MNKRVAFILYLYPLGVSTMIVNSIKMFADSGIDVDIYINKSNWSSKPVEFKQKNVRFMVYDDTLSLRGRIFYKIYVRTNKYILFILRMLLKRNGAKQSRVPSGLIFLNYPYDYLFSRWLSRFIGAGYDYIFPVEARSLIAVSGVEGNIIYYSMELLDWSEKNPIYGKDKILLKTLEYRALQKVTAATLQNEQRAEQFRAINDFTRKIFILPVASMGEPPQEKASFFRDKFSLTENVCIVVYAGNIMAWAKCIEMVKSVRNWPPNYCLVLHTWRKNAFSNGYGSEVKECAKGLPVYFSEEYLDIEDLARSMSSADMALMFYDAIDANFIEILFSSNKLGEYLKAGLPVITFDYPELRKFFQQHGIGRTISTMDELPSALSQIRDHYAEYKNNVMHCYQSVFRFEKYFNPLLAELYGEEAVGARTSRASSSLEPHNAKDVRMRGRGRSHV